MWDRQNEEEDKISTHKYIHRGRKKENDREKKYPHTKWMKIMMNGFGSSTLHSNKWFAGCVPNCVLMGSFS